MLRQYRCRQIPSDGLIHGNLRDIERCRKVASSANKTAAGKGASNLTGSGALRARILPY